MSQELKKFDELKAAVTVFVAPTLGIKVSDFRSSAEAIEAGKQIKAYQTQIEKTRKALVGPLNDQVKAINSYAKDIEAPLVAAETHIKREIIRFSDEQEKIRQEQIRAAEAAKREADRLAELERQRVLAEAEAARQAALEAEPEPQTPTSFFGTDVIEDPVLDIELARLEEEARLDREQKVRDSELVGQKWDIDQARIRNTKKTWDFELIDISLVPKEFLIVTVNRAAVLAAARGGTTNIPGVRVFQETNIAFGSKTYVPNSMLR